MPIWSIRRRHLSHQKARYWVSKQTLQQTAISPGSEHSRWWQRLGWPAVLWITFVHLGALAAPFCYTWAGLWLTVILSCVTGGLGICIGFHRLLTHASFETYRPIRCFFALCGTLSGEGPPIMWVAAHRKHHRFSDQEHDPHSPKDGRWWSHMLWMFPHYGSTYWAQTYRQYAPDLLKDPFLRMLDRTYLWWQLGAGIVLFGLGWVYQDVMLGVSFLVYGMFLRMIYVLHVTWAVNSASHIWGYRNYKTRDNSRNLWWVGLLAYGEGWHNNHHAFQRAAQHGHRWWEIDVSYWVICIMRFFGLAWNVVPHPVFNAANSPEAPLTDDDPALPAVQPAVVDRDKSVA